MKKVKISPNANVISAETLRQRFERLAVSIGDNGLTSSFSYVIINGTYGIKEGINPQTKQAVQYPTIKSVKIGQKSNKVCGIAELSINSLKRTVNVDEQTVDVIDFSAVLPNCTELNPLQLLETLDKEKFFVIVPNGTILANTNFDTVVRPRQVFKVIELTDTATINAVIEAAISAGLIEEETPEAATTKPKK